MKFISIKYPLTVDIVSDDKATDLFLDATATILYPQTKAKAYVSFVFDMSTFSQWPLSIGSLQVDVKVAYGDIQ